MTTDNDIAVYEMLYQSGFYIMCRQQRQWDDAERRLVRMGMRLIKRWSNVPGDVDVSFKDRCRDMNWSIFGNMIHATATTNVPQSEDLVALMSSIIDLASGDSEPSTTRQSSLYVDVK